jgi:hypothetical protein
MGCGKIGKGPSLYYVSKKTGWVGSENGNLCRLSGLIADIVGGSEIVQKNVLT